MTGSPRRVESEPFYIGYLPAQPPVLARFLRPRVLALLVLGLAAAPFLAALHGPFAPSAFEFGTVRPFEGIVIEQPVPMLRVDRPGADGARQASHYLLVAPGKHGAGPLVEGLAGTRVTLAGTLVYRGGRTMIEVVPSSVTGAGDAAAVATATPHETGLETLSGEIVDSKCFLGVMNPGRLKTHRACAARCISGGIPPLLHVVRPDGSARQLLLVGRGGGSLAASLADLVAEPVEITGRVERHGDVEFLFADRDDMRRLEAWP